MVNPDIRLENHGSIWLMRGKSDAGQQWIDDNVNVLQWFGGAAVVEWRYAGDIARGASEAGLEVEVTQ